MGRAPGLPSLHPICTSLPGNTGKHHSLSGGPACHLHVTDRKANDHSTRRLVVMWQSALAPGGKRAVSWSWEGLSGKVALELSLEGKVHVTQAPEG